VAQIEMSEIEFLKRAVTLTSRGAVSDIFGEKETIARPSAFGLVTWLYSSPKDQKTLTLVPPKALAVISFESFLYMYLGISTKYADWMGSSTMNARLKVAFRLPLARVTSTSYEPAEQQNRQQRTSVRRTTKD
jgi:hypothetical protein